ncbi:hypothetical protein NDU88_007631 [Pleurodeles waltl]|uniref:Uncharacterized protein n=1 Tax=Pleurodeles waltl TaxID=8319 RepID=A0AAV7U232_PLEWA|nr:hypothetical protein NDU88_007631 [Pleurodeles waltl]
MKAHFHRCVKECNRRRGGGHASLPGLFPDGGEAEMRCNYVGFAKMKALVLLTARLPRTPLPFAELSPLADAFYFYNLSLFPTDLPLWAEQGGHIKNWDAQRAVSGGEEMRRQDSHVKADKSLFCAGQDQALMLAPCGY